MEATVLDAEERLAEAQRRVEDPGDRRGRRRSQQRYQGLNAAQSEVDRLYARCAELDAGR